MTGNHINRVLVASFSSRHCALLSLSSGFQRGERQVHTSTTHRIAAGKAA